MKELNTFRKFLNENLDEISLRGLMGRDMKGEDLAADPKKLEKTLSKIMKYIGDPSVTDQVRDWLKMDVQEFPDTDYADPENLKLTAKAAAYYVGQEDEPNIDVPPLKENDKVLDEVINGLKAGKFNDGNRYETLYVFSPSRIEDITYGEEELDDVIDIPSGKYHAILWHNADLEVYTANTEEELVDELQTEFFDNDAFGDFGDVKAAANDSEPDGDSNHGMAIFVDGKLVAGPEGGVKIYK